MTFAGVTWGLLASIYGFFVGASIPLGVFVAYRFFTQNRTRIGAFSLVWGIIWRLAAMYYAFVLVGVVFRLPFFEESFELFDEHSNQLSIGTTLGFLGGIIVFILAYRRGKREQA